MTMIESEQRRQRLGAFLKAHRIRLVPQEVGLSATGRRRTPGLRREEVAQLAGISATWYVRIEQGREVAASAATLDRIARVRYARTRRSEEHTSELQSLMRISYCVFILIKKQHTYHSTIRSCLYTHTPHRYLRPYSSL